MQETILFVHILGATLGVITSLATIASTSNGYRSLMIASNSFAVITGAVLVISANVSIIRSCVFGLVLTMLAIIGELRFRNAKTSGAN